MGDITLQTLAKDFARGAISKEDYRNKRSELLAGILSGEITLQVNEYLPLIMPELESVTEPHAVDRAKTEIKPRPDPSPAPVPVQPTPPAGDRHWLLIASVVAILCLAILLIILLRPSATRQAAMEIASVTPPVTLSDITTTSAHVEDMIKAFLKQKNWDIDQLQTFQTQWDQLSQEERMAGQNSVAMRQLKDALYRQLLEEQALASISDSDTTPDRQHELVYFAHAIGIDDARIVVQEVARVDPQPPESVIPEPTVSEETITLAAEEPVTLPAETDTSISQDETETMSLTTEDLATEPEVDTLPIVTEMNDEQPVPEQEVTVETVIEPVVNKLPEETNTLTETEPVNVEPTQPSTIVSVVEETVTKATPVQSTKKKADGCRAALAKKRKPYCRDQIEGIGNGPTMVVLPAGKFVMGGKETSEQPSHEISITNPFAISVHEVTFNEFEQFCKATDHSCPQQPWSGGDYPVVNITWQNAVSYAEWLTEKTGRKYSLPSEAKWEYAARAGTTTTYPTGDEILITDAVFSDRKTLTAPLPKTDRSINRNKFRLYHMLGNVREWVADFWHDDYSDAPGNSDARVTGGTNLRVVRGGSYQDNAVALRAGARDRLALDSADKYTGFRVIQELAADEG